MPIPIWYQHHYKRKGIKVQEITYYTLRGVGLSVDKPLLIGEFSDKLTRYSYKEIMAALKHYCTIRHDPQDENILYFSLNPQRITCACCDADYNGGGRWSSSGDWYCYDCDKDDDAIDEDLCNRYA